MEGVAPGRGGSLLSPPCRAGSGAGCPALPSSAVWEETPRVLTEAAGPGRPPTRPHHLPGFHLPPLGKTGPARVPAFTLQSPPPPPRQHPLPGYCHPAPGVTSQGALHDP